MIVDKKRIENMTVLSVEGIIKLGQSAEFLAQNLRRALEADEGHMIVDLTKINYIDSTGIGELVAYLGRFGAMDRKFILVNPSERVRKLLKVAQLDTLFTMYDDLDSAIAAERAASA